MKQNPEALKLVTVPNPILRQIALPVDEVTDEVRLNLDQMIQTMLQHDGAGLAANQVGLLKRLVVMELEDDKGQRVFRKFINPNIIEVSDETEPYPQGCLSVPGVYADIVRPKKIIFDYLDENGNYKKQEATGLLCHCIQHEIDHLNGILFVDYLSALKKKLMLQKAAKNAKT